MTDAAADGTPAEPLPTFRRPPVVEVVLGFEFQPIADFGALRLAQIADIWQERYPQILEQPPLPTSPPVGVQGQFPSMFVNIGAPAIRLWLLVPDGSQLLQIQRDRLILNWRHAGTDPYPHYDTLRPQFERALQEFYAFVREHSLGPVVPGGVEVSYVNEVTSSSGRRALGSILRTENDIPMHLGQPAAERTSKSYMARSPHDGPATLTLTADTEGRGADSTLITLTYRAVLPFNATQGDVMSTMDVGHKDVVVSFAELTSDEMHTDWERQT